MKDFLDQVSDADFVLLYGSQLGQAKSIAEGLCDTAVQEHNLKTKVFALNDVPEITDLVKLKRPVVIVTSTTGDGDPPENADKFWRKIRRKNLDAKTLLLVRYAILGLGDTNFNNFCNCGKTIHQRLQDLGATVFYPPGWADDGTGLEVVVDDWIQNLWPALKKAIGIQHPRAQLQGAGNGSINSKVLETADQLPSMNVKMVGQSTLVGTAQLQEETRTTLTLPLLPTKALIFEYSTNLKDPYEPLSPTAPYPLIDGSPVTGSVCRAKVLTNPGSVKTTLQITVKVPQEFDFQPGDSIGIVSSNPSGEVEAILNHLEVADKAEQELIIKLNPEVKGKIPAHVPVRTSLLELFTYVCDIRTPPKKALLRHLAESCTVDSEKLELLTLSSKQGASLYSENILQPGASLLDIFLKYPSCKPHPEVLVEHLSRLQPRAYSICSSPLENPSELDIAFNVIEIPKDSIRQYSRFGICTGALYELCEEKFKSSFETSDSEPLLRIEKEIVRSATNGSHQIVIYRRKNQNFRMPDDLSKPIIMVGPGTGVAPFIGFLRHRQILAERQPGKDMGRTYLYFGCRNRNKDFLYAEKLDSLVTAGVLSNLYVSFSRDEDNNGVKYVQDRMLEHQDEIVSVLLDNQGYFYVCGDAKNMAKNVREALIACIQNIKGLDMKDAMAAVSNLVSSKQYLQDIWA